MTDRATGIVEDDWLTAVVGKPVFRIVMPASLAPDAAAAAVRTHRRGWAAAMYYAKVDTARVDVVRALGLAGLFVVDVNVTLRLQAGHAIAAGSAAGLRVCEVQSEHHAAVLDIAATCFRYSRFHLDPLIPAETANRIKREWVRSYIRKERGDRLFVAVLSGRPVGFLAALTSTADTRRAAVIDLIGVTSREHRRGIGRALVGRFIDQYREQCEWWQVGTQAANVPSIRFYESLGFAVESTQYVMHMHVQEAAV